MFAKIGTKFGIGDGSTTFNLPDFRNKTFWGADDNLGTELAAGLPNISGTFYGHCVGWVNGNGTGAFYNGGQRNDNASGRGDDNKAASWAFSASRSNAIYGNSTTVQPPAITVNVFIKY